MQRSGNRVSLSHTRGDAVWPNSVALRHHLVLHNHHHLVQPLFHYPIPAEFYPALWDESGVFIEDVDLANNKICIKNSKHHTTKSKLQRDIPIHPQVLQVIKDLPRLNEFVFQNHYNRRRLSGIFKELVRKSEHINQEIHLHSLRHSFISNLVRHRISLAVIQKLAGHRDYSTTLIYLQVRNDSLEEAISALE